MTIASCTEEQNENQNDTEGMKSVDMYIGTYTQKEGHVDGKAEGIYYVSSEGEVMTATKDIVNPSYIHCIPNSDLLVAVSEIRGEHGGGLVYLYKIQEDHSLVELDVAETSGPYPCHVTSDIRGPNVIVANYGGGVDMYSIKNQRLVLTHTVAFEGASDHPRQDASHPHMALVRMLESQRLYVSDLGANRIYLFDIKRDSMVPAKQAYFELPEYSGPRHLAIDGSRAILYSLNELNSTVDEFIMTKSGLLSRAHSISTLEGLDSDIPNTAAAIRVHPGDNKYVYASNRGPNTIAIFEVSDGRLKSIGQESTRGAVPRDFNLTPNGTQLIVANQDSDNLVTFTIDKSTGKLSYQGQIEVKTPVCIAFPGR